ncbi:hypothetical protein QZH41_006447 [Actinostola sp. cb2023]|nr:hypothetical protein QZH41_006447 [Actinostola sp. cb2023]
MGTLVRRNLARVQANRASTAFGLHSFSLPRVLASRNGRLFDDLAGLLPPQEKFYQTFFDKPRGTLKVQTSGINQTTTYEPPVWNLTNCRLKTNHVGHTGYLNCVTVSPDGSLCASGGKDGQAMLWDLNEGKHLYTLSGGDILNAMTFSPNRYWLCAAVGPTIKIWDLEGKSLVDELRPEIINMGGKVQSADCISLAWSSDGQTLFAGYTDSLIRVWQVTRI